MRVDIGKHINWVGPYQLAEKILFWMPKYDENGHRNETVHKFGRWLAKDKNENPTWLTNLCEWIHSKRSRRVKIRVDAYDTWDADSTMAMIILPLLEQLHATKHGSGFVDDSDVPDGLGLRSTEAPPRENKWDTDDNFSKRYDWVMCEIIWTFRQLHPDCDWEAKFHSGEHDLNFEQIEGSENYQLVKGPKDTHQFDAEGHAKYSARIDNGLRLFGKYYRSLWD